MTVTIQDDTVVEQQFENFFVSLRTSYYDPAVILSPGTTTITIEDEDSKLIIIQLTVLDIPWLYTNINVHIHLFFLIQ